MDEALTYTCSMRVTTGRVVAGKVEVPAGSFAEGEAVTVLAREGDEAFTLGSNDEADLREAMAEGDRGEVVSAEDFFRRLERGD